MSADGILEPLDKGIEVLKLRQAAKLKNALKALKQEGAPISTLKEASRLMIEWLNEQLEPEQLPQVVRPIFGFLVATGQPETLQGTLPAFFKFLQEPKFYKDEDGRRVLRFLFKELSALSEPDLTREWAIFLKQKEEKISENFVCDIIKKKARRGVMHERNRWEHFQMFSQFPCTASHKQLPRHA